MSKLLNALSAASLVILDESIDIIPDPVLKAQIKSFTFAVKVPLALLKEVLPSETEKFIKDALDPSKITHDVVNSAEYQQALGSTLQNLLYVRDQPRRDLIKKIFMGAYISQDEYAKDHMDKLQAAAQQLSIPALQHLILIKRDILPSFHKNVKSKIQPNSVPAGFGEDEYFEHLKRTTPISLAYDEWYKTQKEASIKYKQGSEALWGAEENKYRARFSEIWTEYNSLSIYRQGNDPSIGIFGGGSGTVQYLTKFGENFINFLESDSKDLRDNRS